MEAIAVEIAVQGSRVSGGDAFEWFDPSAGDRISQVHLADSHRMLPDRGHTDSGEGFAALRDIGFQVFVALEHGILGDPEVALPGLLRFIRSQLSTV